MALDISAIAQTIDHTLLRPDADQAAVEKLCNEALNYHFASVCIAPYFVPVAHTNLQGTDIRICTVIGFPLGYTHREIKVAEAGLALAQGAQELDMVINISALKSGQKQVVQDEIAALVQLAHDKGAILKVIIETALLDDKEKIQLCEIVSASGADFIKTSTGFSTAGATLEDIHLMKKNCAPHLKIKASGGIRNLTWAKAMLSVGADRLGTSSGVAIMEELSGNGENGGGSQSY